MKLNPLIARAAGLLAAAAVAALVYNGFSPSGIPLIGQWNTAVGVVTAKGTEGLGDRGREIRSVARAKAVFDDAAAVFVDARSPAAYSEGHIPGAVNLPVREFDDRIPRFWERYGPQTEIVTYCSGRTCEDSHRLAALFEEVGYEVVRIFIDGYPGWKEAGHPTTERGDARGETQTR
jgi:rhodanese-related sulfurtransferase